MTSILVHYSELALKGKNRPWFIHRLVRNLHAALAGLHVKEVRTPIGRIEIVLGQEAAMPEIRDRLSRVFGVANYSAAVRLPRDFDAMAEAVVAELPPKDAAQSFRVHVRRADPKFTTPAPGVRFGMAWREQRAGILIGQDRDLEGPEPLRLRNDLLFVETHQRTQDGHMGGAIDHSHIVERL